MKANIENFENEVLSVQVIIDEKNVKLGYIEQKILDLDDSINKLGDIGRRFKLASMLKYAVSRNGIPLQIVKKVVPRINQELRKTLNSISQFQR